MVLHTVRSVGRVYLWLCILIVGGLVLWYPGRLLLALLINILALPFLIPYSLWRGNYGDAILQVIVLAGIAFLVRKYFDKILNAIAWVYVTVNGLFQSTQAFESRPSLAVQKGNPIMSKEIEPTEIDPALGKPLVSLNQSNDTLLDVVGNRIRAKWHTRTLEEQTKVLQAQNQFLSAEQSLAQSMLSREDTRVEIQARNVEQRRQGKQTELDNKFINQQIQNLAAKERLQQATEQCGKTPQQQNEREFENKRTLRLTDARDEVFEDFEFDAARNMELAKQYAKTRKQIANDQDIDEDLRGDLLKKLEEQYQAQLGRAAKKQGAGQS